MKYLELSLLLCAGILLSCSRSKPKAEEFTPDTPSVEKPLNKVAVSKITTDTLQFIHFDANGDYWDAFFLKPDKDTLRLITDHEFKENMRNTLMKVQWKTDTLFSAGEGEEKYEDKRLVSFSKIKGKLFAKPLTEKEVLDTVRKFPEIIGVANNVWIDTSPTFDKPYYDVGTSTVNDGITSMFLYFRIYTFPKYGIAVFDSFSGGVVSLEQWRKNNN